MKPQHFINISGGADSLATALVAKERGIEARYLAADTGNEDDRWRDYIHYLEGALGIHIEIVTADFTDRLEKRRAELPDLWSRELKRKKHNGGCKVRQGVMKVSAWKALCDCPIRVTPPVPDHLIRRAMELMVPTGIPFLDLCMLKGRFPSRRAQFCTEELKVEPCNAVQQPLLEAGQDVIVWLGTRAEESQIRATQPVFQRIRWIPGSRVCKVLYRPIKDWLKLACFAIADRHGIQHNPLYREGLSRVGCIPCVNCDKEEIATLSVRFPHHIDRIRDWEAFMVDLSRRRAATFFPAPMVPGDESDWMRASIDKAVAWSRTDRGGVQYGLLQRIVEDEFEERGAMCASAYGLCE